MKINFSDYKTLTQNDIITINEIGIECSQGIINFDECRENFIEYHNINGNYIGEFDCSGSNHSIVLYTSPLTTHIFFMDDDDSFRRTIKIISEYGYEFMDVKKLY